MPPPLSVTAISRLRSLLCTESAICHELLSTTFPTQLETIEAEVLRAGFWVDLPLPDASDLGVEAVLAKPCHRKELVGALRRSIQRRDLVFEPDEGVTAPEQDAAQIRLDGEGSPGLSQMAVGRGGASLGMDEWIAPGSSIGFSFSFADDDREEPISLAGWGVVRWCELVSEHIRAGIEFMHLDDASRESFARWLTKERPPSFIPKEPHGKKSSGASP